MTDKQIIIDGVDVSGCKHYKNRTCIADYCLTDMPFGEAKCELNPNCHYKQLKRKEQECERLKNERTVDLVKQLDQLKAENAELKVQNIKYMNGNISYQLKNSLYKQTLTEIKEIAEPYQKDIDKICGNCRRYDGCHACCMDTLNNYEYRTGTTKACDKFIELKDFDINKLANQILQKISECEGNNENG